MTIEGRICDVVLSSALLSFPISYSPPSTTPHHEFEQKYGPIIIMINPSTQDGKDDDNYSDDNHDNDDNDLYPLAVIVNKDG